MPQTLAKYAEKAEKCRKTKKNHFGAVFEGDIVSFFFESFFSEISLVSFQILGVRLVNWLKYPIDCNSFIHIAISESTQQDEKKINQNMTFFRPKADFFLSS